MSLSSALLVKDFLQQTAANFQQRRYYCSKFQNSALAFSHNGRLLPVNFGFWKNIYGQKEEARI